MFGIKGLLWKYNIVTQELRYSALSCTWHVALFKKAWRWDWERIQLNIVQHVGMLYNRQSEHLVVKNIHVLKISTIATKLWNMFCQYTVNLTSQYIFTNLFLTLSLLWYPLNQRCLICILSINSHLYSSNTKHLGHIYEENNACLNVSNDLIVECSSFLIELKATNHNYNDFWWRNKYVQPVVYSGCLGAGAKKLKKATSCMRRSTSTQEVVMHSWWNSS